MGKGVSTHSVEKIRSIENEILRREIVMRSDDDDESNYLNAFHLLVQRQIRASSLFESQLMPFVERIDGRFQLSDGRCLRAKEEEEVRWRRGSVSLEFVAD